MASEDESKQDKNILVIFPTKNEQATIEGCILSVRKSPYKPYVIVSDGHSSDATREIALKNEAEVVMPEKRIHPGKGAAMKKGLEVALKRNPDVVVFLDADIVDLSPDWVDKLVDAVLKEGYDMSRGQYLRAPRDAAVTKLVVKPLLWTFFPEVAHYEQPLSGEVAATGEVWRTLLKRDAPPDGWGIDVWFLIEAATLGYNIKEVFLGTKTHRSFIRYQEDVSKLSKMGEQVAFAIIQEAIRHQRIDNINQVSV